MSRSERLLVLIEVLRRHRRPVSGGVLAAETGVSLRTLYRDIASLQAQGADIQGEPGVGYVLKPGFMLPPLMFSDDEIEAMVLGVRWVSKRTDERLERAAHNALAKIAAVLPIDLKDNVDNSTLLVGAADAVAGGRIDLTKIRTAIRKERKLVIDYRNNEGAESRRTIWPFALTFFASVRIVAAWCEMRQGFRHFRVDRISGMIETDQRAPRRRLDMLKEWRANEGIASHF